jgi:hypothetical protein
MKLADARAFEWIAENLSPDSIFISDEYDTGQYIPFFIDYEVRPPLVQVWRDFPPDLLLLHDVYLEYPDNSTTISLLHKYNITHVYIGAMRFYDWTQRLNVSSYVESPNFDLIYDLDGVNIFSVL